MMMRQASNNYKKTKTIIIIIIIIMTKNNIMSHNKNINNDYNNDILYINMSIDIGNYGLVVEWWWGVVAEWRRLWRSVEWWSGGVVEWWKCGVVNWWWGYVGGVGCWWGAGGGFLVRLLHQQVRLSLPEPIPTPMTTTTIIAQAATTRSLIRFTFTHPSAHPPT